MLFPRGTVLQVKVEVPVQLFSSRKIAEKSAKLLDDLCLIDMGMKGRAWHFDAFRIEKIGRKGVEIVGRIPLINRIKPLFYIPLLKDI